MRKNIREIIRQNVWLKKIPTTLTIGNSLCGFGAILYSFHAYTMPKDLVPSVLALSAYIILGAMVFDALDGFLARIFNAASMHGMQMDSLADMVTFGVAPAVIVSVMAHRLRELQGNSFYFVWLMSAIYLGCAALRLATYNVHAILEKKSSGKFQGLPSPGAAAAICSLIIFFSAANAVHEFIVFHLPAYAGILGLLMVSKIKYIHVGKWLVSVKRNPKRLTALLFFLVLLYINPLLVAVVAINAYVLLGPVTTIIGWLKHADTPYVEAVSSIES
ncbi:MAG: CDP-alcohol phosphatidyltransferase family protein [Victivallales bacterium]|nr:CDP-alcohol phosphatidyltransferase family protein [Victivallales bacterium]